MTMGCSLCRQGIDLSIVRETARPHVAETKSIAGEAEGFDHIIARPLLQVTKARRMIVGNFPSTRLFRPRSRRGTLLRSPMMCLRLREVAGVSHRCRHKIALVALRLPREG